MWLLFALLNAFFESIANALGKRGAQSVDVLSAAWAQRFFALFLLLPLAFFTHSFSSVNEAFWIVLIFGSILKSATTILFIKAIKDSPLSLTLPIVTFTPVFLLITSPLMIGELPTSIGILGILSTVVGSYILNLDKKVNGPLEPILSIFKEPGPRLMLIVAFIWSITSNTDKIGVSNSNPILFTLADTSGILFILTLILLARKTSFKKIFQNRSILAPIGLASGLQMVFQMMAISMTLVPNVITVKRTSSLFGILWGKLFFKEKHIKERILGTLIMILGVVLITLSA